MEIEKRTGHDIYFDGCDVREANKKSNYSEFTSKKRTEADKKVWVSFDDLIKWINKNYSKIEDATLHHHSNKVYTNQSYCAISRKEIFEILETKKNVKQIN